MATRQTAVTHHNRPPIATTILQPILCYVMRDGNSADTVLGIILKWLIRTHASASRQGKNGATPHILQAIQRSILCAGRADATACLNSSSVSSNVIDLNGADETSHGVRPSYLLIALLWANLQRQPVELYLQGTQRVSGRVLRYQNNTLLLAIACDYPVSWNIAQTHIADGSPLYHAVKQPVDAQQRGLDSEEDTDAEGDGPSSMLSLYTSSFSTNCLLALSL